MKIYNAICSFVLRRGFLIRCAILVKYSIAFRRCYFGYLLNHSISYCCDVRAVWGGFDDICVHTGIVVLNYITDWKLGPNLGKFPSENHGHYRIVGLKGTHNCPPLCWEPPVSIMDSRRFNFPVRNWIGCKIYFLLPIGRAKVMFFCVTSQLLQTCGSLLLQGNFWSWEGSI